MNSPNSDLLDIAQRVQDYTETQGYPKKELAELSLTKKKKIKKILEKEEKEKSVDLIFDLGLDQGTAIKIVKNCDLVLKQIEKEIGGN